MVLSLFTGFSGSSAAESAQTAQSLTRGEMQKDVTAVASKEDLEGAQIAMPLVMDQSTIGFYSENLETEVNAYMTDIWYLGVLTIDEYASFFPVWLNMDRVEYLSRDMREYIKGISESQRLALRSQAEAKLNIKRQFVWEAAMDGEDYSDKLSIQSESWTLYEATETSAPTMACRATVTWIGEKPTTVATSTDLSGQMGTGSELSMADLLDSTSGTGESKDVSQESQEVQDFLWELYKSGLVQSNSDYDLSAFEERAKAEGITVGQDSETVVDINELIQQAEENNSSDMVQGSEGESFNLMSTPSREEEAAPETGAADHAVQAPEAAGDPEEAGLENIPEDEVPLAAAPEGDDKDSEEAEPAEGEEATDVISPDGQQLADKDQEPDDSREPDPIINNEDLESAQVGDPDPVDSREQDLTINENESSEPTEAGEPDPAAAADPDAAGIDEDGHVHTDEEDQNSIEDLGMPYAYFGVHMMSNTNIEVYDAALYFPSPAAASEQDAQPAEQSQEEPTRSEESGTKGPTMEEQKAEIRKAFNAQNQGPNVAGGEIYQIRAFSKKKVNGELVPETYAVKNLMEKLFTAAGGFIGHRDDVNMDFECTIGVLDERVARYDKTSGELIMGAEGRTAVYAMGVDEDSKSVSAVVQLEVRDLYYLSSENEEEPDVKRAVPMISAGKSHSLALMGDGTVYGWGDGTTGALGEVGSLVGEPQPIYAENKEGGYAPLDGIVAVAAGDEFSMALTEDGHVYAWGSNFYGQLGVEERINSTKASDTPLPVLAPWKKNENNTDANGKLCGIVAISAGTTHAMALSYDGTVYAWGRASYGALGQGTVSDSNILVTYKKDADGKDTTEIEDTYTTRPIQVMAGGGSTPLTKVIAISAGSEFSVALTVNGQVYTWGDNRRGQLGTNESADNRNFAKMIEERLPLSANEPEDGFNGVVAISAWGNVQGESTDSSGHTVAISIATNDLGVPTGATNVWGWGENVYGQVGNGTPTSITGPAKGAIRLPNAVAFQEIYEDTELRTVSVSAGATHTLAVVRKLYPPKTQEPAAQLSMNMLQAVIMEDEELTVLPPEADEKPPEEENEDGENEPDQDSHLTDQEQGTTNEGEDRSTEEKKEEEAQKDHKDEKPGENKNEEETGENETGETGTDEKTEQTEETDKETEEEKKEESDQESEEEKNNEPDKESEEEKNEESDKESEEKKTEEPNKESEEEKSVENEEEAAEVKALADETKEARPLSAEEVLPEDELKDETEQDLTTSVDDKDSQDRNEEEKESGAQGEDEDETVTDTASDEDTKAPEDETTSVDDKDSQDKDQEEEEEKKNETVTDATPEKEGADKVDGDTESPEKEPEDQEQDGEPEKIPEQGNETDKGRDDEKAEIVVPELTAPDKGLQLDSNTLMSDLTLLDEGEVTVEDPAEEEEKSYKYYAYGWGYDGQGALAQGYRQQAGAGMAARANPIQLQRVAAVMDGNDVKKAAELVEDVGGVAAGTDFSFYWIYDGDPKSKANGTVMGTGNNGSYNLGASEALIKMGADPSKIREMTESQYIPVRVGSDVYKQLIFNKVWVYTNDEDPDTGTVSRVLTGRYADRPATVPQEGDPGDKELAANVDALPVNLLTDTLTITDRQDVVVFRSGIRRYYNVGFNLVERDRAVPTPKGVNIDYSAKTGEEYKNAAYLDVVDTDDLAEETGKEHETGKNNALLYPGDEDQENRYGFVEFDAIEDYFIEDQYSGFFTVEIKDADNFTIPSIQAGNGFMIALKSDGSVWAWGDNSKGQLGSGVDFDVTPYTTYPMPVAGVNGRVKRLQLIEEIAVGYDHAMARTADGCVYTWGSNQYGQLGLGKEVTDVDYSYWPRQVVAGDSVLSNSSAVYLTGTTALAAGGYHSMALMGKGDGYIYTWGSNDKGQLGEGHTVSAANGNLMRAYPSQVIFEVSEGDQGTSERFLSKATMIAAGGHHSLAAGPFNVNEDKKESGQGESTEIYLAGWGDNYYGQLGYARVAQDLDKDLWYSVAPNFAHTYNLAAETPGETEGKLMTGIRRIAAGERHTVVLTGKEGSAGDLVRVMGDNSRGQIGNNTVCSMFGNEWIQYAGDLRDGDGAVITNGLEIVAGPYYTMLLRGKRGTSTVDVYGEEKLGPIENSEVYFIGHNDSAQMAAWPEKTELGVENPNIQKTPVKITFTGIGEGKISSITGADHYAAAMTEDGQIWTWGTNDKGQLGDFSLVDHPVPAPVGYEEAWLPSAAGFINYGGDINYDVVVEVQKDHEIYPYSNREYKLVLNTPVKTEVPLIAETGGDGEPTGRYKAEAKGGNYSIYARMLAAKPTQKPDEGGSAEGEETTEPAEPAKPAEWEDTGADLVVIKGRDYEKDPGIVDFFTITYKVVDEEGTAGGSTISAIYNDEPVNSGTVVWGNGRLVITAVGMGGEVPDYRYAWSEDATAKDTTVDREAEQDGEGNWIYWPKGTVNGVRIIEKMTDTVNAVCMVSGPTLHQVSAVVKRDDAEWGNSGKRIRLVSSFTDIDLEEEPGNAGNYSKTGVPSGIYTVYDGAYNTGKTVKVAVDHVDTPVLRYHALEYEVTPTDGVVWAYIQAYYTNGKKKLPTLPGGAYDQDLRLPSGAMVLEGAEIGFLVRVEEYGCSVLGTTYEWGHANLTELGEASSGNQKSEIYYRMDEDYASGSPAAFVKCNAKNTPTKMTKTSGIVRLYRDIWDRDLGWMMLPWAPTAEAPERDLSLRSTIGSIYDPRSNAEAIDNGAVWASYPLNHDANGYYIGTNIPIGSYILCENGVPLPGMTFDFNLEGTKVTTAPRNREIEYYTLGYTFSLPNEREDGSLNTASNAVIRIETAEKLPTDEEGNLPEDLPEDTAPRVLHAVESLDANNREVRGTAYVPKVVTKDMAGQDEVRSEVVITVVASGSEEYTYDWSIIYEMIDKDKDGNDIIKHYPNNVTIESTTEPGVAATAERNQGVILDLEGVGKMPALTYRSYFFDADPDVPEDDEDKWGDESVTLTITGTGSPTSASAFSTFSMLSMLSEPFDEPDMDSQLKWTTVKAMGSDMALLEEGEPAEGDGSASDSDNDPSASSEKVNIYLVPDREPVACEDRTYSQSDLLLKGEIELVAGDTVDITGTVESYISSYLLKKNSKDSIVYRNTNKGGAKNEAQPYVGMPFY